MLLETTPSITTALVGALGGLIAGVASAIATTYANSVRRQRQVELIQPRLAAYRKLWALMEEINPALFKDKTMILTVDKRTQLRDSFRQWYFKNGNGIFLSRNSRDLLVEAKDNYLDPSKVNKISDKQISEQFSKLRNQMRQDIAVYGKEDAYHTGKRI